VFSARRPPATSGRHQDPGVTLGVTPRQPDMFRTTTVYCAGRVAHDSIYGLLHRECAHLFPDAMFADLFTDVGRRSVPPMIVAVVMVLQRVEGCSDREAVDRFAFDVRWKYAAGGLEFDYPGFVHTVLVDMRARLARSTRPDRIFEVTLEAANRAGLVGRRRVLDSTPLYDAVATMDTAGSRDGRNTPAVRGGDGWTVAAGFGCPVGQAGGVRSADRPWRVERGGVPDRRGEP